MFRCIRDIAAGTDGRNDGESLEVFGDSNPILYMQAWDGRRGFGCSQSAVANAVGLSTSRRQGNPAILQTLTQRSANLRIRKQFHLRISWRLTNVGPGDYVYSHREIDKIGDA